MSKPTILLSLLLTACIANPDDASCPSCRSERLTLDDHGFYDAGSRWLSSSSDPMLRGRVTGNQPVHIYAGKKPLGAARIENEQWSLRLPPDTITKAGVLVRVVVDEPADDATEELLQVIALDEQRTITYPPPVFDGVSAPPATTLGE